MKLRDSRLARSGRELPKDACLDCGKKLDAASRANRRPKPGDASICLGCGHVMIYGARMRLREPTGEEIVEIARNPEILETQRFIALYRETAKREGWT